MENQNKAIEEKKPNNILKILSNIIFIIFMIIMITLIINTGKARIAGTEPSILGHKFYIVEGGSMSPTIRVGSLIIVKELEPKEIEKGDIITFHGLGNSLVTHRVLNVENNSSSFITKGDANGTEDALPVDADEIVGKVVLSIPFIGSILAILNTKIGLLLFIIVILISILLRT